MNSNDDVLGRIRAFVFDHFPIAHRRKVSCESALRAGGIVDPLGVFEIVEYLENEFDISLHDEDVEGPAFETLTSLAELVRTKKKHAQRPQ
jgi:acyl carrier protein